MYRILNALTKVVLLVISLRGATGLSADVSTTEVKSTSPSDIRLYSLSDLQLLKGLAQADELNLKMRINDLENDKTSTKTQIDLAAAHLRLGLYRKIFSSSLDSVAEANQSFESARATLRKIFKDKKARLSPQQQARLKYWLVLSFPESFSNLSKTAQRLATIKNLPSPLANKVQVASALSRRDFAASEKIPSYSKELRALIAYESLAGLVKDPKSLRAANLAVKYLRSSNLETSLPPGFFGFLKETAIRKSQDQAPQIISSTQTSARAQMIQLLAQVRRFEISADQDFKLGMLQARGFSLSKENGKSVPLYKSLALKQRDNSALAKEALVAAISIQHTEAKWARPSQFQVPSQDKNQERRTLLGLYTALSEVSSPLAWSSLAELGTLEIYFSAKESAFSKWQDRLSTDSQSLFAQRALGFMLEDYARSKSWDDLERLSRLALEKTYQAKTATGSLKVRDLLALALLYGAEENLAASDVDKAVTRLTEYCDQFTAHRSHDKGLALLARAQKSRGELAQSLLRWKQLVKNYPQSSYRAEALLEGAEIAQIAGSEDLAALYWRTYLEEDFGSKKKTEEVAVARKYGNLQEARGFSGESISVYRLMIAKNLGPKLFYQNEILRLSLESGATSEAALVARSLLKEGALSSDEKHLAWEAIRLDAKAKQNKKALVLLSKEVSSDPRAAEIAAEIRLDLILLSDPRDIVVDFQSIALKEPGLFLKDVVAETDKVIEAYMAVCQANEGPSCIAAMHQGSAWAEDRMNKLSEVQITSTLGEGQTAPFEKRKQSALSRIFARTQEMTKKAQSLVAAGQSTPSLTREVLWSEADQWFLDSSEAGASGGYLEYSINPESNKE